MKKAQITGLICSGALSLVGSSVFAQQPPAQSSSQTSPSYRPEGPSPTGVSGQSSSQTDPSLQPGQTAPASASSTISTSSHAAMQGSPVRLSHLIGSSVQSVGGQSVGNVRDVILDPQGRVGFVVLSMPGTGGISESSTSTAGLPGQITAGSTTSGQGTGRLVPVPWELFSMNGGRTIAGPGGTTAGGMPGLTLSIDQSRLATAPSIDQGNWNELQQGDFTRRAYSFYGLDWNRPGAGAVGTPGTGVSTGTGTSGSSIYNNPTPGTGIGTPGSSTGTSGTGSSTGKGSSSGAGASRGSAGSSGAGGAGSGGAK